MNQRGCFLSELRQTWSLVPFDPEYFSNDCNGTCKMPFITEYGFAAHCCIPKCDSSVCGRFFCTNDSKNWEYCDVCAKPVCFDHVVTFSCSECGLVFCPEHFDHDCDEVMSCLTQIFLIAPKKGGRVYRRLVKEGYVVIEERHCTKKVVGKCLAVVIDDIKGINTVEYLHTLNEGLKMAKQCFNVKMICCTGSKHDTYPYMYKDVKIVREVQDLIKELKK